MNSSISEMQKILLLRSKIKKPLNLIVSGTSMLPILHDGDIVLDNYEIGDILVFFYKQNELLVHRLLKIEKDRYLCKGDNAFRLEDISKEEILGAVLLENDKHKSEEFINDSYRINRIFRSCKYNTELTKQEAEYQHYRKKYFDD